LGSTEKAPHFTPTNRKIGKFWKMCSISLRILICYFRRNVGSAYTRNNGTLYMYIHMLTSSLPNGAFQ
jgi:hypothetical protein